MYNRILIPTDGSDFSRQILPYARYLAEPFGARITLLQVIRQKDQRAQAEASLAELTSSNCEALVVLEEESVADTILMQAKLIPQTLIATTTHGRSGLSEVLLGSVARNLVAKSHQPVMLFRPTNHAEAQPPSVRTVYLALDGSSVSETLIDEAVAWTKALDARLFLLQVVEQQDSAFVTSSDVLESNYLRRVGEHIGTQHGIEVNWDVLHGDPIEALTSAITSEPNPLVMMTTRARAGLAATLLGSVTAGVLRRVGAPVVVQKPAK